MNKDSRKKLNQLKWAMIVLPPIFVGLYETVRHSLLEDELFSWWGNLIAALIVLIVSYLFSQTTFKLIFQMQGRLASQNEKLTLLNQRIKELAIIEERSRLSREFHDGLAQTLAFAMMKTDTLKTLLANEQMTARQTEQELEQVYQACQDAYSDVREAITGLRPEIQNSQNFPATLAQILERFGQDNDIETNLEVVGVNEQAVTLLPIATTVQLLRVVQEALTNIRKHAYANCTKINLNLSANHPIISLTITDNGVGFDLETTSQPNKSFGLTIMRERITGLGGNLQIESSIGRGTTLKIYLPSSAAHTNQQPAVVKV